MLAPTTTEIRPSDRMPRFIAVLGMLMAFGPMAIDMYLPALTAIGTAFRASQAEVQLSLSAFFLGFGLGQVFWGALSDWLGRRGPVAAGILLYILASLGCSIAPDIVTLSVCRFIQALGACAGPVLARAMVRDRFPHERAASVLSMMMLVMGVAPMAAPFIGGQILLVATWRTIFWAQAVFGGVALLGLASIPETLPLHIRRGPSIRLMLRGYLELLANRRYLGYALCSSFVYAGMFAYISGTPYVYMNLYGVRPENYGYLFGVNIVGMIIVNTINSRLVLRYGADRLLRIGCIAAGVVSLGLVAVAATGFGGLAGIAIALFVFLAMTGMIGANAMAGAMAKFPHVAGSASALTGMRQFTAGAFGGWAVGLLADTTARPMALVMCGTALVGLVFNLMLVPRMPR